MEKLEIAGGSSSPGSVLPGNCSTPAAALYDAAIAGSVAALDDLLKQYGKVILYRVSLTSFAESPLHLAALMGHLKFSRRLLELRPELASEQDSKKCTPLHLAAANGHDQIVKELLKANGKACLIQDREGRVPLHLAAMRGRIPVVRELLKSTLALESVKKKVDDGDSILHLCVKYHHLEVLKLLLGSTSDDGDVLKMTDSRGNTVFHLAVMLKQIEMVRFLLELPRVRTEVINITNRMGFTVLDVLNHSPKDFKSLEICEVLAATGAGAGAGAETVLLSQPRLTLTAEKRAEAGAVQVPAEAQVLVPKSWKARVWHFVKQIMEYSGDWMNDTKGNRVCVAGNAVLAYYYPDRYYEFMKYDMVSFLGSLVVLFLVISGFPLSNKFCLWLLCLVMSGTVTCLGYTFFKAMWLVVPGHMISKYNELKDGLYWVWAVTAGIVGLFLFVRMCYWLGRFEYKDAWRRLRRLGPSALKLVVDSSTHWKSHRADSSGRASKPELLC
ncbi:hypothetical protein CRG98_029297 [Punica granatum]|uniref:Uncharacterized protein n=1 Tax=Punica granatum TaxID=22663 RepID=A0A2I0J1W4_PUNGR|nr:hypothetical protein CRG98_029297 [Punica granatum]